MPVTELDLTSPDFRISVDVGDNLPFDLAGTGLAGYAYTASFRTLAGVTTALPVDLTNIATGRIGVTIVAAESGTMRVKRAPTATPTLYRTILHVDLIAS